MFGIKKLRRARLRASPFPLGWLTIIERNVPYYHRLPEQDRKELLGHVTVFMSEKNFEGCAGLEITDEVKVTVAAYACILLLHRETDYYPGLYSILMYPGPFVVKGYEELWPGVWAEATQVHVGESWRSGALILSWDDVQSVSSNANDGHNVVLHEFAHQLDSEDGKANGAPALPHRSMYAAWASILGTEFESLREDARLGRETLLDKYGATNPAEFFAVITECFFERPLEMQAKHPALYSELRIYFRQDPAKLFICFAESCSWQ